MLDTSAHPAYSNDKRQVHAIAFVLLPAGCASIAFTLNC